MKLFFIKSGRSKILSKKSPTDWIGKEVVPGTFGIINHGGLPKILTKPGRYPGFPLRNWWARTFVGTKGRELPSTYNIFYFT